MGDLMGAGAPPGAKFLHLHAVLGKNWSNSMFATPLGLTPPMTNPGFAPNLYESNKPMSGQLL